MLARTAAAIIATAALGLPAAGCGGSSQNDVAQLGSTTTARSSVSSNSTAASARVSGAVAYSACMRSHGVTAFPDPARGGGIPKVGLQQLGVSAARFQAAGSACRHLLPNGGQPPSRARQQQVRAQGLQFAACVRSHGVPNFPDPGNDGRIPDPAGVGINQGSPKFQAANSACGKYRPPYMPSNAAYNTWARTHG